MEKCVAKSLNTCSSRFFNLKSWNGLEKSLWRHSTFTIKKFRWVMTIRLWPEFQVDLDACFANAYANRYCDPVSKHPEVKVFHIFWQCTATLYYNNYIYCTAYGVGAMWAATPWPTAMSILPTDSWPILMCSTPMTRWLKMSRQSVWSTFPGSSSNQGGIVPNGPPVCSLLGQVVPLDVAPWCF